MKFARRTFVTSVVLLVTISACGYFFWYKSKFNFHKYNPDVVFKKKTDNDNYETMLRLRQKAVLAKAFMNEHDYNSKHCFLLDMKQPSGKKRFFVYNVQEDSIEISGLVAHGSGSDRDEEELNFSNIPNSNCTSLGKYKIGKSYMGKFGLAYKLYGLDNTNNKAFERFVVLHSHSCVPDEETAPFPICESWGCPTVSPAFLEKVKEYVGESKRPILLWIYY